MSGRQVRASSRESSDERAGARRRGRRSRRARSRRARADGSTDGRAATVEGWELADDRARRRDDGEPIDAREGRWTDGARRALASWTQKKQTAEELQAQLRQRAEAQARLVAAQQAAAASAAVAGKRSDEGGHSIGKAELQQMLKELAPELEFDEDVQEVLLEITDDFVDTVLEQASILAKHRGSEEIEVKDVLLPLERQWDMHIPGYSGEEVKKFPQKRLDLHSKRMAAVRRTVAAANAAQIEAKKQAKLAAERAAKKGGDAEDA